MGMGAVCTASLLAAGGVRRAIPAGIATLRPYPAETNDAPSA
jgi:hypothetical protein